MAGSVRQQLAAYFGQAIDAEVAAMREAVPELREEWTVKPDPPVSPEQRAAAVREACTGLRLDA